MKTSRRAWIWMVGTALLVAGSGPSEAGGAEAKIAFEGSWPSSVRVGGAERLADGVLRVQRVVLVKADGTKHNADLKYPRPVLEGARVEDRYGWGTVSCTYRVEGARLDLEIGVANAGQETIHEIWLRPLAIRLPDGTKVPRPGTNIGAPTVLTAETDGGVLALCNTEIDRPLHVALGRPSKGAAAVQVRAGGDRMIYDELYMRRPIGPGKTDTYRLSLRFGPAGSDPHALATDVYRAFAAAHPPALHWPDRRPIARVFLGGGLPAEQVLAYYRAGEKGELPTADEAFRKAVMKKVASAASAARQIDAQGLIVWDIEGSALPHPTTYIGDPRLTRVLNPQMDAVADDYFAAIRDAGLRCGVCIRPSRVIYAKDRDKMMQSFGAAKDPFTELDAKIRYCKKRWGCSLFYTDTNYFWRPRGEGGKWTPGMLDAAVWRRLHAKHPKVLLIPEHNYMACWATTAVYREMDLGYKGIAPWIRRVYPEAFCVPVVEDADPHENWDTLVRLARGGDCLMTFTYGLTRNARAIKNACIEAKLLDAGPPAAVKNAAPGKLAALLKSRDLATRFFAARALGERKAAGAAGALLAAAMDAEEHWLVRKNAILALGERKAAAAAQPLGRLLKDKKADLAHFVTRALKQISNAVAPGTVEDTPKVEPLAEP